MSSSGTALLSPDDASRERARHVLRERIDELATADRELGIATGDGLLGKVPQDVLDQVERLGTDIDPIDLSLIQSIQAMELVTRDLSRSVKWGWPSLDELVGPMLPGELWLVGATTGNGKSTFLHNWQSNLAKRSVTSLCFPLEVEPAYFRLRSACWQVGIPMEPVLTHDWAALEATEEDVRTWLSVALDVLRKDPHLHVAPTRRVSMKDLHRWIHWGVKQCGAEVVVIDHLHRLEVVGEDASTYRVAMTELARELRDVARALNVVIVCAVQLNREHDPLDDYFPPMLTRIKEASAIAEEATAVLMLSRDIDPSADGAKLRAVKAKRLLPSEVERRGCMVVCCRKHRRRGSARHKSVRFRVSSSERIEPWNQPPTLFGEEL